MYEMYFLITSYIQYTIIARLNRDVIRFIFFGLRYVGFVSYVDLLNGVKTTDRHQT